MTLTKKEQTEFTPFTPDIIKNIVGSNDDQCKKALLKLYAYQTSDEQMIGTTRYINGVGFSGADADILTSFAKQLQKNNYLSPKQMNILRKKMTKYSKQLARIANFDYFQKNNKVMS